MATPQRLETDHRQCVLSAAGQPGQDEQQQTVVAVQLRSLDAPLQHDGLLAYEGVIGDELRPRTGEVTGRGCYQPCP